jgi:hypothetical protein
MASAARAELEALLRTRKLDTTLTSARPLERLDEQYVVPTGIDVLDARLLGGLARGQLSEIVGPRSSGRTAVLVSMMAGAASRGELVALVDTFDTFDPGSGRAGGLDLTRLLWVRGEARAAYPACSAGRLEHEQQARALDRAVKAFSLILQAGIFDLAVLDLADAPGAAIRRLPFTTWLRLQRPIEGSSTAAVIVADAPVSRSAGGVTIALRAGGAGRGAEADLPRRSGEPPGDRSGEVAKAGRLFPGLTVEVHLARARGLAESCRFELRWDAR